VTQLFVDEPDEGTHEATGTLLVLFCVQVVAV